MRSHRVSAVILAAIALTVSVVACGSDVQPTAAATRVPSKPNAVKAGQPFSGRCETSFAPPTFPPPPVIRQVDDGICQLSHLGRTSAHTVQDIDIVAGTQQSLEITFTAANGDILRAATVGTNTPNGSGVSFQATMTFSGGTGRFANATGQATVSGAANFQTNTAWFEVDGEITYGNSLENNN